MYSFAINIFPPIFIQAVAEMLKKALRTLMDDFAPLSTDVSHLVVNMFTASPQPSLLDLSKQVSKLDICHAEISFAILVQMNCWSANNEEN